MYKQLTLDLHLRDAYTFSNFVAGDNKFLLKLLSDIATDKKEQQVFIWGEHAIGKSHLLQATCQLASESNLTVSYLPFDQIINYSADILDGLEAIDLVCVDNIDFISGKHEWQVKVFDLINRMRAANQCLIFSAKLPPNELSLELEDLRSRLNWGPVVQIKTLSDSDKQAALQLRAQSRGFELADNVASFMLNNYARDLSGLFEKLEKLDKASLEEQRRLTIPFVKSVFDQ